MNSKVNNLYPRLRVAIAGLGTVGAAVARRLSLLDNAGIELIAAADRSPNKQRDVGDYRLQITPDPLTLAARNDVDVVVETMGGSEGAARELTSLALCSGKDVVTANKALLAYHGAQLASLAQSHGRSLKYESAVCSAMPVVASALNLGASDRITSVMGVLNGTCNFILSAMETEGVGFAQALAEAQSKGYAESDPTLDVSGEDAAHKLAILAAIAFGGAPDMAALEFSGIEAVTSAEVAAALAQHKRLRLVGIATRDEHGSVAASMKLRQLDAQHPLFDLGGTTNGVVFTGEKTGNITIIGAGAGGEETASGIVGDLLALQQQRSSGGALVFGRCAWQTFNQGG